MYVKLESRVLPRPMLRSTIEGGTIASENTGFKKTKHSEGDEMRSVQWIQQKNEGSNDISQQNTRDNVCEPASQNI